MLHFYISFLDGRHSTSVVQLLFRSLIFVLIYIYMQKEFTFWRCNLQSEFQIYCVIILKVNGIPIEYRS